MHYMATSAFALTLAFGLLGGSAWGDDVTNVGFGDTNFFHGPLAEHGQWVNTANYGRAWQPKEVLTNANWRPYVDGGHWTYTDDGWYWDSSYSWGWAVFHYGRWNQDAQYKWLWTPDVTWAPAWVSWRQSDAAYGWAPLPYGARFEGGTFVGTGSDIRAEAYHFVPAERFLSTNLRTVAIEPGQVAGVYAQTAGVKNSYTNADNRIINNGIPLTQVAIATKQTIEPTPIADVKSPSSVGELGKISAYRPTIATETTKASPVPVAAGKNSAEAKDGTSEGTDATAATVPASYIEPQSPSDSRTGAAEAKTAAPKAVEPRPAKAEPKTFEPRTVKPNRSGQSGQGNLGFQQDD